ncbi:S-layer homology domain-containing protein [Alicyclobacillus curvatus]|nr:S-layer homology domain-containing protein [Alicyclobacillus curvatus]
MHMQRGALGLISVAIVLGTGCTTALAGTLSNMGTKVTSSMSVNRASGSVTSSAQSGTADVRLTQQDAINIVEKAFPDLATMPGMSLNVSLQSDPLMTGRQTYQLIWNPMANRPNGGGPNLTQIFVTASVDAKTGQITQFRRQVSDWKLTAPLTADKAQTTARTLLKQLAPNYASQMVLEPDTSSSSNGLSLLFVRKVGGVIAPFDRAQIDLSPDGQLTYYQFNWIPATIPAPPTHTISRTTATTDFMQALHMHLSYQQQFTSSGPGPMELVYSPVSVATGPFAATGIPSIDAVTGQPLGADGKPLPASSPSTGSTLHPLVQNGPVDYPTRLAQPLTQAQVEQAARKMLNLSTQDWTVSGGGTGSITTASGSDDTLMVSFTNSQTNENISFGMDTSTGVVTSYNDNPGMGPGTTTATSTSAGKTTTGGATSAGRSSSTAGKNPQPNPAQVADAFVEKMFPHLTGAIARMTTQSISQYAGPGQNPSQGIQYAFLVHGVPVNAFAVYVDTVTGKVVSYNVFQDPSSLPNLPNPSGAISESAAKDAFLQRDGLVLQYMLPNTSISPSQPFRVKYASTAKLVYAPIPLANGTGTLDAITGQWIPFPFGNTTSVTLPSNPTQQDKAIALLESHGIIRSSDSAVSGSVNAAATITRIEFERWLERAYGVNYGGNTPLNFTDIAANSPYRNNLMQGVMEGWLTNGGAFRPNDGLTRLQAAHWLISWMGWAPVAAHANYFQLPFADTSAIPATDQGSVAIAVGSGMIPMENGAFHPNTPMTIGQAALAMVTAVQTLQSSTTP